MLNGLELAEAIGIVGNAATTANPYRQGGTAAGLVLVVLAPTSPLPVASCVLPVLPENYNEVNRYLCNIQPTLIGGFVDKLGPAPGTLTLRGKFRMVRKQVVNLFAPIPVDAAGAARWLREVCDLSSGYDRSGNAYRVVLYNFLTKRHWQVAVHELSLSQSTDRNTVWMYSLQIDLLRPLPSKAREMLEALLAPLSGWGMDALITSELDTLLTGWMGL